MKIRYALILLCSYGCALYANEQSVQEAEQEFVIHEQEHDDSDDTRFCIEDIEDFMIDHNVMDYITVEEPSELMVYMRIIGCPILMAYLHTKEKLMIFLGWCNRQGKRLFRCETCDKDEEKSSIA